MLSCLNDFPLNDDENEFFLSVKILFSFLDLKISFNSIFGFFSFFYSVSVLFNIKFLFKI